MSAPSADQAQGVSTRVEHTLNDYVNNYRLPTSFCKDHVEHRIEYSDRARGIRKAYKKQRWVFDKVIGGGGFGLVRLQKETKTQQLRAVKEVRYLSHAAAVFDPIRELTAMAALSKDESNFAKLYGWYKDDAHLYIAMEYFELGDLRACVSAPLPETECQVIIYQITEALDFMHSRSFAHRDLKPSNILVARTGPLWWVKIADFGISKQHSELTHLHTSLNGGNEFAAPEIMDLTDEITHTNAVDMWSLGCLASWLCIFDLLLRGPRKLMLFSIGQFSPDFDELTSKGVSAEGVDLVSSLIRKSPGERLTASQALQHPWISVQSQIIESDDSNTSISIAAVNSADSSKPNNSDLSQISPSVSMLSLPTRAKSEKVAIELLTSDTIADVTTKSKEDKPLPLKDNRLKKKDTNSGEQLDIRQSENKHENQVATRRKDLDFTGSMLGEQNPYAITAGRTRSRTMANNEDYERVTDPSRVRYRWDNHGAFTSYTPDDTVVGARNSRSERNAGGMTETQLARDRRRRERREREKADLLMRQQQARETARREREAEEKAKEERRARRREREEAERARIAQEEAEAEAEAEADTAATKRRREERRRLREQLEIEAARSPPSADRDRAFDHKERSQARDRGEDKRSDTIRKPSFTKTYVRDEEEEARKASLKKTHPKSSERSSFLDFGPIGKEEKKADSANFGNNDSWGFSGLKTNRKTTAPKSPNSNFGDFGAARTNDLTVSSGDDPADFGANNLWGFGVSKPKKKTTKSNFEFENFGAARTNDLTPSGGDDVIDAEAADDTWGFGGIGKKEKKKNSEVEEIPEEPAPKPKRKTTASWGFWGAGVRTAKPKKKNVFDDVLSGTTEARS